MDGFGGMRPGMLPLAPGMMPPGLMGLSGAGFDSQGADDGRGWKRSMGDPGVSQSGLTGATKEGSVFYKTRICHKFAEGHCPFGERCNYAHGEAELRDLPPEGQQILDHRLRGQESQGRGGPPPNSPPANVPRGDFGKPGGGQSEKAGVRSTAFKSRLCTRFMQKGECPYGPTCHFAHGYDDLQTADAPGPRPQMEMSGFELPMGRPGMMMPPGGPMMPPEFLAMAAMGGMGGGPPMMPPRPRPPPGPPPPGPPSMDRSGGGTPFSPEAQGFLFDVTRTPTRLPSDVPYLDRVKAGCVLLGVGRLQAKDAGREAMEAAVAAIQTGEAFEANPYADALHLVAH